MGQQEEEDVQEEKVSVAPHLQVLVVEGICVRESPWKGRWATSGTDGQDVEEGRKTSESRERGLG